MIPIVIKVEELESICSLLIKKAKSDGIESVTIDTDNYWVVVTSEWNNFNSLPEPGVGSLVDDWGALQKILRGQQIVTYLDFERFASILRAVTESIAPASPEDEEMGEEEPEESSDNDIL